MFSKRIFVSGGAGVIGTALINLLLKENVEILVGDLKPCPIEWLGKVRYWQGDLNTIPPEILKAFDPHVFFHLAATFERSEESYPFFEENFHHNVCLSHYLMRILKESNALKKVIFASSYLIYDPDQYQFAFQKPQVSILDEESSIYPRNTCGGAKLFHELELRFLEHFFKEKVSFISARIFRVYGFHSKDVISRWVRAALKEDVLTVYRAEGQFDYIFADDVAEALFRLSQTEHNGIVNVGSGEARSVKTILDILSQYFPNLCIQYKEQEIPFEHSQANIQKLEEWTRWKPQNRLENVIPRLIEFERTLLTRINSQTKISNVLVMSISKKMPLLTAVLSAAKKTGEIKSIHGCDANPTCIGKYGVDEFWHCPSMIDLTIEKLIDYCTEHSIKMIIPTRDGDLPFLAQHASQLKMNEIHIFCSSLETVLICQDKKTFADFLISHQFQSIPTFLSLNEIDYPYYVVKERIGAGSVRVALKISKNEALSFAKQLENPIFQPYIEGKEWSIDLYRSKEGEVKGCVARLRDCVIGGESQVTTTVSYPLLENYCIALANQLNIYGHAVVQVIEDEKGQFHIIECNLRFGGASTASLAVGLDSFYWFFVEALGRELKHYPFHRHQQDIRQIRYSVDKVIPWSSSLT